MSGRGCQAAEVETHNLKFKDQKLRDLVERQRQIMNGLEHHLPSPVTPIIGADGAPSSQIRLNYPTIADARIASLKVLVFTLLTEIESLENRLEDSDTTALNLAEEVHRFEAALIRVALSKTGGRQRRAARLLGTKVTTLNTKIKRYGIA